MQEVRKCRNRERERERERQRERDMALRSVRNGGACCKINMCLFPSGPRCIWCSRFSNGLDSDRTASRYATAHIPTLKWNPFFLNQLVVLSFPLNCKWHKHAYFMQMYVYYYCDNPKQWWILSRIFSRISSVVVPAQTICLITLKSQAQQATTDGHIDLNVTFLSDTATM